MSHATIRRRFGRPRARRARAASQRAEHLVLPILDLEPEDILADLLGGYGHRH